MWHNDRQESKGKGTQMPGIFVTHDPELEAIAHTGWGNMPWAKIPANWRELPDPFTVYYERKKARIVRAEEFLRARQVLYRRAYRRRKAIAC